MNSNPARRSSRWTPRLLWLTAVCSAVFTIGTAVQNFVIVDLEMLEHTMRLAGRTPAEAAANAPGFLTGFRAVGCVYIAGNVLGLLALSGRAWVFWVVLAVNVTQAAGVFVIPPEVFRASLDLYGPAGPAPSIVTDGGALLLSLVLLGFLARYRTPWARPRPHSRSHSHIYREGNWSRDLR